MSFSILPENRYRIYCSSPACEQFCEEDKVTRSYLVWYTKCPGDQRHNGADINIKDKYGRNVIHCLMWMLNQKLHSAL